MYIYTIIQSHYIDTNNLFFSYYIYREDLRKPLFSGVFARIRLYLVKDSLPKTNDLVGQAKYWKLYYNSVLGKGTESDFIERVNEMNKKYGTDCNMCEGRMNLVICMDGSGSIESANYLDAKEAAENLIDTFSNNSVDVGYVLFSSSVEVLFPLKSNFTRDQMKDLITNSQYPGLSTQTHRAIQEGITILGDSDDHSGKYQFIVLN